MRSKRVVIMGGAGFLGSHLAERLIADGSHVVVVDDLSTGSLLNVDHLRRHARFTFMKHDVVTPFDVRDATRVYNLACPASPPVYQRDPVRTTLTSVLGTLHGLELARKYGARFFQASTSEVYGDPDVHPQPESYRGSVSTTGIRACYDEGKRCAESLVMDFARQHATEVRIARIFNTYGPRMAPDDGRVVSNFVVQALRGEDLTLYGDGQQTRSFCYVDDLVDGIVRLMEHPTVTGPVNLGNPEEFTMRELAQHVLRMTKSASGVRALPLPADDPRQRRPDITLAGSALGFRPRVKLEEGLARTVENFAARLAASRAPELAPELERARAPLTTDLEANAHA